MPPRFDDDSLTLRLSVADVLERDAARSLGFASRGGYERMWLGQALHSRYQERALATDPTYEREVAIEIEIDHRGWTILLRGRIDGVRRAADGTLVVEEIKSVRPGSTPGPATVQQYRRQAQLYTWMIRRQHGAQARAELIWIELGIPLEEAIERELVECEDEVVEASVRRRVNALLREHQEQRVADAERRAAAERLEFPFHHPRPGQTEILESVECALEQREHLLVEAATGLGKTVASLFPVLRFALANNKRVFVLTAKTTQQRMANDVLELLNKDASFHSQQLRAKARMCANHEMLCHEEYCDFAKDYFLKLSRSRLLPKLLEGRTLLDPDTVYEQAREQKICPFEASLELVQQVQAVVCDYNYAFERYVSLREFGEDHDLGDTVLVVDEIHNLVDRGRGYFSPRLSAAAARRVDESATSAVLGSRLELLARELARVIEEAVDEQLPPAGEELAAEGELPEERLWSLRPSFDRAFVDYLEHRRETRSFRAEDPFVQLYFDYVRFLNTLELARELPEAFSLCLERTAADRQLFLLCKDASRYLGRVINRCHSVIGLSATLSPPELYRDLLGFDPERTSEIRLPNPFPSENRIIAFDPGVRTTYRERERYYDKIAARIVGLCDAVPGNCLVLFPSYRFLASVAECLPHDLERRVLVQKRADGERERGQILDALQSSLFGDVLLLAVAGGVFAEGVDYPGDMLKAVAVIGPCLPAVTLEKRLLQEYYEERFERGFEFAFVVPGMTRVVQAAGRLIRSDRDRGVIALIGRRFLSSLYQRHMPRDWLPEDSELVIGKPGRIAAEFFSRP